MAFTPSTQLNRKWVKAQCNRQKETQRTPLSVPPGPRRRLAAELPAAPQPRRFRPEHRSAPTCAHRGRSEVDNAQANAASGHRRAAEERCGLSALRARTGGRSPTLRSRAAPRPRAGWRLPATGNARRLHGRPARGAPLPPDTCSTPPRPRRRHPRSTARRGRAPAVEEGGEGRTGGRGTRWRRPPVRGRREGNRRQRLLRATRRRPTCAWWGFLSQAPAKSRLAMAITHPRGGRRAEAERFPARPAYGAASPARLGTLAAKGGRGARKTRNAEPAAVSVGDAPSAGRTTGRGGKRPSGGRGARTGGAGLLLSPPSACGAAGGRQEVGGRRVSRAAPRLPARVRWNAGSSWGRTAENYAEAREWITRPTDRERAPVCYSAGR